MVRLSELSEQRNLMESSLPPHLKILIRLWKEGRVKQKKDRQDTRPSTRTSIITLTPAESFYRWAGSKGHTKGQNGDIH